jgi:hypothetical protein
MPQGLRESGAVKYGAAGELYGQCVGPVTAAIRQGIPKNPETTFLPPSPIGAVRAMQQGVFFHEALACVNVGFTVKLNRGPFVGRECVSPGVSY